MSDFPHIPSLLPVAAGRDTKRAPDPKDVAPPPRAGVRVVQDIANTPARSAADSPVAQAASADSTPVAARRVLRAPSDADADDAFRTPPRPAPAYAVSSDEDSPPPLQRVKRAHATPTAAGLPASGGPREADRKQGPPPSAAVSPAYASHALYAPDPSIVEWTALRDEVAQITGCDPELPTDWVPHGPAGAHAAAFLCCAEEDLVGLSDQEFRAGVDAVHQALSDWAAQRFDTLSLEEVDPRDQAGAAPAKPDPAPPR